MLVVGEHGGSRRSAWLCYPALHGCPREQNLVHHSGSGWLARPSPWGTFTSYSLPASWRTPSRANCRHTTSARGTGSLNSFGQESRLRDVPICSGDGQQKCPWGAPSFQMTDISVAVKIYGKLVGTESANRRSRSTAVVRRFLSSELCLVLRLPGHSPPPWAHPSSRWSVRQLKVFCMKIDGRLHAEAIEIGLKPFVGSFAADVVKRDQKIPIAVQSTRP